MLIRGKCLFQCRYPKVQHLFQTWCLLGEIQYSVHLPNEGLQIFKYQLCQGCFCRNFLKTFRTAFSKNTAGRVLLISWTTFNPLTPGGNKRSYILKQTQQASLYCFRKIYKMWFLPHLFCCHDLFTFQKFCTCVDDTSLVPKKSTWQLLERQQEIMAWSSSLQEERFICRLISRFISLIFYQFQLLWTYWVFTSYFVILKIFCMSLFEHSQFWAPTHFPKLDTTQQLLTSITGIFNLCSLVLAIKEIYLRSNP